MWDGNRNRPGVLLFSEHPVAVSGCNRAFPITALALENILTQPYPYDLKIPQEIESKAYIFPEYAKTDLDRGESPKFAAGHLFMVKLGDRPDDPLWAIDSWGDRVFSPLPWLAHLSVENSILFPSNAGILYKSPSGAVHRENTEMLVKNC